MNDIKDRLTAISSDTGLSESEAICQLLKINEDLNKTINKQENPGFFNRLGRAYTNKIESHWNGSDVYWGGFGIAVLTLGLVLLFTFIGYGVFGLYYDKLTHRSPSYTSYFMVGGEQNVEGKQTQCYYIFLECVPNCKDVKSSGCIQDHKEAMRILKALNASRGINEGTGSINIQSRPGKVIESVPP